MSILQAVGLLSMDAFCSIGGNQCRGGLGLNFRLKMV